MSLSNVSASRRVEPLMSFVGRANTNCSLFLADCLTILPELKPGSVDVVVTSPPYNLGIAYNRYDDTISREDYLDWLFEWAGHVKRVLAETGSLFLNIGAKPSDPWVPFEVVTKLRSAFCLQNVIHWVKSIAIDKTEVGDYGTITDDVTVGHYKPINSDRYLNDCHEYVFHLTKAGSTKVDRLAIGVPYMDKSNVTRWQAAGKDVHCRGNTWFVPYKTIRSRSLQRPHPASFPVELASKCIRLHGVRDDLLVMDPFLGIGHAGVAAMRLPVNFVGIEMDPDYYAVACDAIQEAVVQPIVPESAGHEDPQVEPCDPEQGHDVAHQLTLFS